VPGHPITTPLRFRHRRVAAGPTGELLAAFTDYRLTPNQPIGELSRDDGSLLAQRRVISNVTWTQAKVTKTYAFTNPAFANWPTVACDTFFGELAVRMASNCATGYNEPDDSNSGEDPMPPEDKDQAKAKTEAKTEATTPTVDALVQQYSNLAKKSVETYAELTSRAAKRISGETPPPAGSWVDDAATFWATVARDTAMCLNMHSQLLQAAQPKPAASSTTTTPATPPTG
jgi:hypothetical protein